MAEPRLFADLKADHDRQRDLLARIAETSGDTPERRELFEELMLEISAHAAAEEETLYATMLANPDLREDARHSVSEHKEVDDMLGELREMDMATGGWLTHFKTMRHRYEHHIGEEEEDMFPAAEKKFSAADSERLGKIYENRKPKERAMAEASPPGSDERE